MTVSELHFIDFIDRKEPWNTYKLEDGTTLRVKVVLKSLLKESDGSFAFGTTNVIATIPDPKYIGLPSIPPKGSVNLESEIEANDLEVTEKTELWNEYDIPSEEITLKVMGVMVSAARTSRHDEKGIPLYVANIQCIVKPQKKRA